jgi:Domain of unknown function (DUF1844)
MNEINHEVHSAMFAQLVMQQANLAFMLLGKMPNPETGETMRDLEGARVFISQVEMIEGKTKGNLTPAEAALLKQTLMSLHLAYVEAAGAPPTAVENKTPPAESAGGV